MGSMKNYLRGGVMMKTFGGDWKKGLFLLTAWLTVFGNPIGAQTLPSSTLQDPFDSAGASARDVAMGNAFVGVADDSSALFFNPAGLATLKGNEMGLHHLIGLDGISQDIFTLGMPLGKGTGLGFTAQMVNYGTFEGRNADGTLAPSNTANQVGMGLGGGLEILKGLSVGADFRGTIQQLAYDSYTLFDADAGLLYSLPQGWRFGVSYENFGSTTNGATAASILRVGLSKLFSGKGPFSLLTAAAYSYEPQYGSEMNFGAEASLKSTYFIRAGYQLSLQDTGLNGLQGVSAGAGVAVRGFCLDYAFVPFGDLGSTNRISLTYHFGGATPAAPGAAKASTAHGANSPSELPLPSLGPPLGASSQAPMGPAPVIPEPVAGSSAGAGGQSLTVQFDMPSPQVAKGEKLEQAGQLEEALKAYRAAIKDNPQDAKAWWDMANLYYRFNHKDYAVQCFEQVVKLKPEAQSLAAWLEKYKTQAPTATP
jgi:hypothetical protein